MNSNAQRIMDTYEAELQGRLTPSFSYKIVLVGNGGVGKTTYVKRLLTNEPCESKYVATLGVEVHPLRMRTNYGTIVFNCWDTAGVEKFGGLRDGYYILGEGAIVMGSVTDEDSLLAMDKWYNSVAAHVPEDKIVRVYNKVSPSEEESYYGLTAISVLRNENLLEPFLLLARKLTGHEDLQFV